MAATIDRLQSLRVRDVMNCEVVTVRMHQTMTDAATVLARHEISGAPVVDEQGRCVGMLTARDFVGRETSSRDETAAVAACDKAVMRESPHGPWVVADVFGDQVAAYMAHAVQAVTADTRLVDSGRIMCAQHVHRLPVLDDRGHPLGMITSLDIVASLVQAVDEATQDTTGAKRRARASAPRKAASPLADDLDRQHVGLRLRFDAVRKAVAEEHEPSRLATELEAFAREAEEHFRHEEAKAGFAQVVAHAPQLANRAQALLGQHPRFREQLNELVGLAREGASRSTIAARFDALVKSWLEHETAENELQLEAYTQDLGIKD